MKTTISKVVLKALHNQSSTDSAFEGEKDTFCSGKSSVILQLQKLSSRPMWKVAENSLVGGEGS